MAAGVLFLEIFELSRLNLQTFLVFSLAFLLAYRYLRCTGIFPPYPAGRVPVLGHLLALGRAPHLKLTEWRRQYGDVFTVRMGMEDVVVLNGYPAVKDALVDRSELFASRGQNYLFDVITGFGTGISSAQWGKSLRQKRKFASTVLRTLGVKEDMGSIEEKIREETGCLCVKVAEYEGVPFDPESDLQVAIANVICSTVFGNRFEYGDERFKELAEAVLITVERLGAGQIINVFPFLRFVPGVNRSLRDVIKGTATIHKFVLEEISRHRLNLDRENPRDFLDFCLVELEKREKVEDFTEEQVMYIVYELFIAGLDTTTNTMRWCLLYMVLYPYVQKKVQAELDAAVGGALPALSHRALLPYTQATLMEVQRIRPVGPLGLPHATTQDVTVGQFELPMGAKILTNLHSLHMDPAYWPDPDRFDPERFLDAEGNVINKPKSFLPFGGGRRGCLGEQLAKMQLFLLFSSLLQNFTFKLPEGAPTPSDEGIMRITLTPHSYKLCAIPR
ncbi:cytochrome P450 2D4-like [Branchiostoma lanceolatum]|uniref:cytochrome P450 2D4-like n=1 Tax=Branchiostoma lanceolatum TaxID=7740 RepID=UPI003454B21D